MKLIWITDPHLDHASHKPTNLMSFMEQLKASDADALVITGDIAEAPTVEGYLKMVEKYFGRPVYFVLGNHDYYGGHGGRFPTMSETRQAMADLTKDDVYDIHYLPARGVVKLSDKAALVGHDGWYDGRYANPHGSRVQIADFTVNPQFSRLTMGGIATEMRRLADEAAYYLRGVIEEAAEAYEIIVVATHVPPFRECATYNGKPSDDHWAPWMTSQATGDLLLELAGKYPSKTFLVLCGHSHGGSDVEKLSNLRVITGEAHYKYPRINGIFEF